MNKAIKGKQDFYNKALRLARLNKMYMKDIISLKNTIADSKRNGKIEKKYGRMLDWENKEFFCDRLYLVPIYSLVKGKKVSLNSSLGLTKAQFEAQRLDV